MTTIASTPHEPRPDTPDDKRVLIFDTTLRDGEQSAGAALKKDEKLQIARVLAALGVDVLEAGFPFSSPQDFDAVEQIALTVGNSEHAPAICALARTTPKDIESAWHAIKGAKKPRIHTFIATSDIHIQAKFKKTRDDILKIATDMVAHAKSFCPDVEFSAEDAGRTDPFFLYRVLEAVIDAGATTVNIPDTVGYTLPDEFGKLIKGIVQNVPNISQAVIAVHCHDDLGLATANSILGVLNGARQIECTINGIGERAGNAAMEEVVMALKTRPAYFDGLYTGIDATHFYEASQLVSRLTGISIQPNKAIIGRNAFAHESGIHQDGFLKGAQTYEIMSPESVGLPGSVLPLGPRSGRAALNSRLKAIGFDLDGPTLEALFEAFKRLADAQKHITDDDLRNLMSLNVI